MTHSCRPTTGMSHSLHRSAPVFAYRQVSMLALTFHRASCSVARGKEDPVSASFNRRRLLQAVGVTAIASAAGPAIGWEPAVAATGPVRPDAGVSAFAF